MCFHVPFPCPIPTSPTWEVKASWAKTTGEDQGADASNLTERANAKDAALCTQLSAKVVIINYLKLQEL